MPSEPQAPRKPSDLFRTTGEPPPPPTPESVQVTLHEGTAPKEHLTIAGGLRGIRDPVALPWPIRWGRREAAFRNLIAQLREPEFAMRLLPATAQAERDRIAGIIEALLNADDDPRRGGLP